jgi:diguanylate cyclase (GGDEF)-like protein
VTPPRPAGNSLRRVWNLTGLLAVAGIALYMLVLRDLPAPDAPFHVPWWALIPAFILTEIYVVHIQFRREAQTYGLADVVLIFGLFFVEPALIVPAQMLGAGIGLFVHRRQRGLKLCFNVTHMGLSSAIAAIVFHGLAGQDFMSSRTWFATLAAILTTNLIADLSIGAAIWMAEGVRLAPSRVALGAVAGMANTSLGLTTVVVAWTHPAASWALLFLVAIMHAAHRAYASLQAQHERLETLYTATRAVHGSIDLEEIGQTLLAQLRTMFRAHTAEIVLFNAEEGIALRTALSGNAPLTITPATMSITPDTAVLIEDEDDPLARELAARGIGQAMVAPLIGNGETFGSVLVGDREGNVRGFNHDDLKQFETAVKHASVSLENASLVSELRRHIARAEHQANHDALTGLGNRALFDQRLAAALRETSGALAVFLLDLDRFKEVNDTLGHRNGDALLKQLATRLRHVAGRDATVARFGGDEFCVLTPVEGHLAAAAMARTLLAGVDEPFVLEGLSVVVEGSIGIAVSPEHGSDPQTLVQRADVAMYLAKAQKTGFEFYDQERDEYSPARLALVAELREAIERDELVLHYQPKVASGTGIVRGAEALVRWQHPRRGLLSPMEFIPLAEQTGLAAPLTFSVLDQALHSLRAWRDAGHDISVAVNLPPRMLLDADLPDRVRAAIEAAGVPAAALTLEVTESSVMEDQGRSLTTLAMLEAMGVHMSIDDFGTGYSSLSRLKQIPASEIKIDRSFIQGMLTDASEDVIVRSTIDLGKNLGRTIVAEGVETREEWDRLSDLGCDAIQGYFISKPLPGEQFLRWLTAYRPPTSSPNLPASPRLVSFG